MQNRTLITDFRAKRMQIGVSEQEMAHEAGLTEEYYRRLERENLSVPQKVRKRLKDALIRLHPEPLTLLFDYVRIRFRRCASAENEISGAGAARNVRLHKHLPDW